jgi:tRNA pseudouridine38-40 synthase
VRFLKITLAYDGTEYCGWQVQPNGMSIQQILQSAWHKITAERTNIVASGRTDAGVHAIGQVCSVRTESTLDNQTILRALNANIPYDIVVRRIDDAPEGFHAIRDAIGKRYRYSIQFGDLPDPFARKYCWYIPQQLDVDAMRQASQYMIGKHDFASFQAAGSDRATTVRNIFDLQLINQGRALTPQLDVEIEADGFLYNMVRNIVGTLVEIGKGKHPPQWITDVLNSCDRTVAGPTAPPQGLFLLKVWYE